MTPTDSLNTALLDVRAYLLREAQNEEFRNEAAWEAGSSREEHAAIDALARLDEALSRLKSKGAAARSMDSKPVHGTSCPRDMAA